MDTAAKEAAKSEPKAGGIVVAAAGVLKAVSAVGAVANPLLTTRKASEIAEAEGAAVGGFFGGDSAAASLPQAKFDELAEVPIRANDLTNDDDEDDDYIELIRLRWSPWRTALFALVALATGGLLFVASVQFPYLAAYGTKRKCRPDEACHAVLIRGINGLWAQRTVRTAVWDRGAHAHRKDIKSATGASKVLHFDYQSRRFALAPDNTFCRMRYVAEHSFRTLFDVQGKGLTSEIARRRLLIFGANRMRAPVPPLYIAALARMFRPVFLFQCVTFVIWIIQEYFTFAVLIIFLTILNLVWELYIERTKLMTLDKALKPPATTVSVLRDGVEAELAVSRLVPGDIVYLNKKGPVPCDIILLEGPECLADESNLRGNAMPISKQPLEQSLFAGEPGGAPARRGGGPAALRRTTTGSHFQFAAGAIEAGTTKPAVDVQVSKATPRDSPMPPLSPLPTPRKLASRQASQGADSDLDAVAAAAAAAFGGGDPRRASILAKPALKKTASTASAGEDARAVKRTVSNVSFANVLSTKESAKEDFFPLTSPEDTVFDPKEHTNHVIYSGTTLLDINGSERIKGLVFRTGFLCEKGVFFHRILFPKNQPRNIFADMFKYYGFMLCMALFAFIIALIHVVQKYGSKMTAENVFLDTADIVTVAIPPALFLLQSVVLFVGRFRIQRAGIKVQDPFRIALAGRVEQMCLDKTGCLTSEKLVYAGAHPVRNGGFREMIQVFLPGVAPELERCLAVCHGLIPGHEKRGANQLDQETFAGSGWSLLDPDRTRELQRTAAVLARPPALAQGSDADAEELVVLRRFDFDVRRRCTSSLALGAKTCSVKAYVKGAPESVRDLCLSHTVPANFDKIVRAHQEAGLIVLACAFRTLPFLSPREVAVFPRVSAECGLEFCGFVLLRSPLKQDAVELVKQLNLADIRPVMVTGDAVLTAIHVSRTCDLLPADARCFVVDLLARDGGKEKVPACYMSSDEARVFDLEEVLESEEGQRCAWAVTGAAVAAIRDRVRAAQKKAERAEEEGDPSAADLQDEADDLLDQFQLLLRSTRVFGRVLPDEKGKIVRDYEQMGIACAMVGDGLNDCAGLREASCGIAVADTEAATVAPFYSARRPLNGVTFVIRQGRCSLVTSYAVFKFMALCPVLQLLYALILHYRDLIFSANQYLFEDAVHIFPVALTIALYAPRPALARERPQASLINLVATILGQVAIAGSLYAIALWYLTTQTWCCPPPVGDSESVYVTVTWLFSNLQFIAFSFSVTSYTADELHRVRFYRNPVFMFYAAAVFAVVSWFLLAGSTAQAFMERFQLVQVTDLQFKAVIYGIACGNFVLAVVYERYVSAPITPYLEKAMSGVGRSARRVWRAFRRTLHRHKLFGVSLAGSPTKGDRGSNASMHRRSGSASSGGRSRSITRTASVARTSRSSDDKDSSQGAPTPRAAFKNAVATTRAASRLARRTAAQEARRVEELEDDFDCGDGCEGAPLVPPEGGADLAPRAGGGGGAEKESSASDSKESPRRLLVPVSSFQSAITPSLASIRAAPQGVPLPSPPTLSLPSPAATHAPLTAESVRALGGPDRDERVRGYVKFFSNPDETLAPMLTPRPSFATAADAAAQPPPAKVVHVSI